MHSFTVDSDLRRKEATAGTGIRRARGSSDRASTVWDAHMHGPINASMPRGSAG